MTTFARRAAKAMPKPSPPPQAPDAPASDAPAPDGTAPDGTAPDGQPTEGPAPDDLTTSAATVPADAAESARSTAATVESDAGGPVPAAPAPEALAPEEPAPDQPAPAQAAPDQPAPDDPGAAMTHAGDPTGIGSAATAADPTTAENRTTDPDVTDATAPTTAEDRTTDPDVTEPNAPDADATASDRADTDTDPTASQPADADASDAPETDLTETDLTGTDLTGTDLTGTAAVHQSDTPVGTDDPHPDAVAETDTAHTDASAETDTADGKPPGETDSPQTGAPASTDAPDPTALESKAPGADPSEPQAAEEQDTTGAEEQDTTGAEEEATTGTDPAEAPVPESGKRAASSRSLATTAFWVVALPPAAWTLVVVAGLATAGVLLGPPALAVPAGLALAFALPGAALSRLIFADRSPPWVERVVLVPALSLAVLVMGGLLLHTAGITLGRDSWAALTGGIVVVATVGAHWRSGPVRTEVEIDDASWTAEPESVVERPAPVVVVDPSEPEGLGAVDVVGATPRQLPSIDELVRRLVRRVVPAVRGIVPAVGGVIPAVRHAVHASVALLAGPGTRRGAVRLVPLVLIVALLGGAGWLSLHSAARLSADTVTALSVLPVRTGAPSGRTFEVAVTGVPAGDRFLLRITATDYAVVLPVSGGDGWHQRVSVPGNGRVALALYRVGATSPYRSVSLGELTAFDRAGTAVTDAADRLE